MNRQDYSKDILFLRYWIEMNNKMNINFYFTPRQLTANPLIFNTKQISKCWKDLYELAVSKMPIRFCPIPN